MPLQCDMCNAITLVSECPHACFVPCLTKRVHAVLGTGQAYLFRIEPGTPTRMMQVGDKKAFSKRHRYGEGPCFGERGADLCIDLDKPHRSRSMLGGTYECPAGENDRTFLAGAYSGWPVLDVACFQVHLPTACCLNLLCLHSA